MKNKKENQPTKPTVTRKQGRNAKEFVPPSKNAVREMNNFKQPSDYTRPFKPEFEPIDMFPEWPGDEEAKNFDFGYIEHPTENSYLVTQENIFYDSKNDEINLPISLLYYCQNEIKWLRPEQYIREYLVDKEIKNRYPNKNNIKLRKRIKETFYEMNQDKAPPNHPTGETDQNQSLNNSNPKNKKSQINELTLEEKRFRTANKEIFKHYEIPLDIKIVNYVDSEAADKEMKETKSAGGNTKINFSNDLNSNNNNNNANNKDAKANNKNAAAAVDKNKKAEPTPSLISIPTQQANNKIPIPSDLSLEERLPHFSKWMSSLMQVIKDLEMFQVYSLIYPQKDGIPVCNPAGKYWVKLYHMGKFRKIEIDDRMPCSKYDEFLLPRCEAIEELWPAILSKAIIKLYSYRTNRMKYLKEKWYNEVGDISVLYSLTGLVPEHLNLNFINDEKFDAITNLLEDSRFLNNQKYFVCYNNYSLESTSIRLNYKLNFKADENHNYLSSNTNRSLVDQPFQGLNIFKNYLKKARSKNQNTFLYSEFTLESIPNQPLETLNTDPNSDVNLIAQIAESAKKSDKINLRRPSIAKNSDAKGKIKSKSKTRTEHKLVPVKEITSPLNTSSTPKNTVTASYSYKKNNSLRLNLKDEITLNRLNPISFKDCLLNLQKEKEANERFIRLALLGKEKIFKISSNLLSNLLAANSLDGSEDQKSAVAQVWKINFLMQKQEKNYKENSEFLAEQRLKSIFSDMAYSVTDIFYSGDEFNMKRLQPVDFTDLKKKILAAQTNFKLLTAQEKKNYISNLKELRLKHKDEKKQRLLELNQPGERVFLIKLKNGIKNAVSSFLPEFSEEEISMAKKCLLNNWRFPPPGYFESTFSKVDLHGSPGATKKPDTDTSTDDLKYSNSMKLMNTSWTKDFYVNMLRGISEEANSLNISHLNNKTHSEEPEIYKNCREVVERPKEGVWISWQQFLNIFKGFLIVHNPKLYRSVVNIDSNWYNYRQDVYYSEKLAFFLSANSANVSLHQNNYNNNNAGDGHPGASAINNAAAAAKNPKEDKAAKDVKNAKDAINNNKDKDSSHLQAQVVNPALGLNANINPISAKYNTDLAFGSNLLPNTKFYNNLSNSCFLIVFEPNTTQNYLFSDVKYYIMFDLISTSGKKIFTNIKLSGFFATYQFDEIYFDQEYYLIVTGGVHPFGYNLRILSDHFVETLTYFNYIKKLYGLNQHSMNVAYPSMEKNKIFVMARVKITNKEKGSFMVSVKQSDGNVDNYLKQFYDLFLVDKNQEKRVYFDKLEELEASEDPLHLILTIVPPYSIPEGSFDLEFLSGSKNIKIELIDLVEPYEVSDKYVFNKHGILMKEQLYIPENTNGSLEIELKRRSKNFKPPQAENMIAVQGEEKTSNQNTNTIFESVNGENTYTEFQKLNTPVRLILEIKKDEKQIYSKQFFTKTFISNLDLGHSICQASQNNPSNADAAAAAKEKKDPKAVQHSNANSLNVPFNLILKLDISECPNELKGEYEDPEFEYFWFVRIFATENIAFMKDTSKEEAEASLKEGWEAKQPGRAERAKLSRKKYLLHVKKQRGELLSPEEESLLSELRNRVYITHLNQPSEQKKVNPENTKKSANVNAANNASAASNTNQNKSNKNANNNSNNVNDPLSDDKGFNQAQLLKQSFYARMYKTRTFPKPENHCSLYLKNFLSYVYRDRTIEFNNKTQKKYLDESKVEELSKTVDEKVLEYNTKRKKEELDFNEKKSKMVEETNQIQRKHFMQRRQFSSKLGEIFEAREKISSDFKAQNEKEKQLQELLAGDFDLERSCQIYKEVCINSGDYQKFKALCVQVFTFISEKKEEIYKNEIKKFNVKDKAPLLKCLEDYRNNSWNISEETIKKMNELVKN